LEVGTQGGLPLRHRLAIARLAFAAAIDPEQPNQPRTARGVGLRRQAPGRQGRLGQRQQRFAAGLQLFATADALDLPEAKKLDFAGGLHWGKRSRAGPLPRTVTLSSGVSRTFLPCQRAAAGFSLE